MRGVMLHHAQLKKAARRERDENFRFCCFLKQKKEDMVAVKEQVLQYLTQDVCNACQNCCRFIDIEWNPKDIEVASTYMQLSYTAFVKTFLKQEVEETCVCGKKPCPFMKVRGCAIYDVRPAYCASFPFSYEDDSVLCLFKMLDIAMICPAIYEMFHELKQIHAEEFFRIFRFIWCNHRLIYKEKKKLM